MKEVKNEDIVDLFSQELTKKQRKEEKKIACLRAKEKRKLLKKEKKLEKLEDIEFAKKIEENNLEEDNVLDVLKNNESLTRSKINEKINKKHYFLNFILGLFIVLLLITSCDYFIYNILKEKEIKLIITSSLLISLSIFYILSIIIKKEQIKKFFQILSTISITAYMCYQLFII